MKTILCIKQLKIRKICGDEGYTKKHCLLLLIHCRSNDLPCLPSTWIVSDTHLDTNATGHGLGIATVPELGLGLGLLLRLSEDLFVDVDVVDGDDACSKASPIIRHASSCSPCVRMRARAI